MKTTHLLTTIAAASLLAACGGGDSAKNLGVVDNTPVRGTLIQNPPPRTAFFSAADFTAKLNASADGRSLLATAWVEEYGGPGDGYYSRLFSTVFQFDAKAIVAAAKANTDPMQPFDLNNNVLHPRRYDALPQSWAVATLAADGELRLLSPTTTARSTADAADPSTRRQESESITSVWHARAPRQKT